MQSEKWGDLDRQEVVAGSELKESLATGNSLPWGCDSLLPVEVLKDLDGLAWVFNGKLNAAREL